MHKESKKEKDLHYRRKTKVRNMIDADYTLNQIAKHMNLHQAVVDKIYQEVLEELRRKEERKKNTFGHDYFGQGSKVGSLVGARQEPYYDPKIYSEERLMNLPPKYDYNRLSDSEKEIWHNEKRTRDLLRSDKEGTVGAYPPEEDYENKVKVEDGKIIVPKDQWKLTQEQRDHINLIEDSHRLRPNILNDLRKESQTSKNTCKKSNIHKEPQTSEKKKRIRKDESEIPLDPKLVKKIENNKPLTSEEEFYLLHTPPKKRRK